MVIARTRQELDLLINEAVARVAPGECLDLNHIDVSRVVNFSGLFHLFDVGVATETERMQHRTLTTETLGDGSRHLKQKKFHEGRKKFRKTLDVDVSMWDVSSSRTFKGMFRGSMFSGDLSRWSVGGCADFGEMFMNSSFDGDIGDWDMRRANNTCGMFCLSDFTGDLSRWELPANGWGGGRNWMFELTRDELKARLDPETWWGWSEGQICGAFEWTRQEFVCWQRDRLLRGMLEDAEMGGVARVQGRKVVVL